MKKLDKFSARRKEIVKQYNKAFSKIPEIIVQKEIPQSDMCRHLYIIRLNLEMLRCLRREFFDAMSAENDYGELWDGYVLYDLYKYAETPYEWHGAIKDECEKFGGVPEIIR